MYNCQSIFNDTPKNAGAIYVLGTSNFLEVSYLILIYLELIC